MMKKEIQEGTYCVRLVTGDDVIGKMADVGTNGNGIVITKPFVLGLVRNEQGIQLAMQPMLQFSDKEEVFISYDDVLFTYAPKLEISNIYFQNTTNLVMASQMPGEEVARPNLRLI